MKKPIIIIIALFVALSLIWVATREKSVIGSGVANAPVVSKAKGGTICVVQYVSHPLLDAVYDGFRQELEKQKYPIDEIKFTNANGDATTASLLADKVCKQGYSVIFALATPMAQSVKSACPATQPILFGAITDPKSAGLVQSMEAPGGNMTGTSDQWPYELQMQLIAHIWGDHAKIGVPFNPAEANTKYAMDQVRRIAQRIGLELYEVPINSMSEASQAVDALAGKVVAIYIPADNTAVAAAPGIIAAADRQNIPVVAGDPGTFKAGAVIGLGVDYKNLGILNARQAVSIMGGSHPSTMSVQVSNRPELYVSEDRARRFHLDTSAIRAWYNNHAISGNH